jgi:carbohydrate-selective porin OprB
LKGRFLIAVGGLVVALALAFALSASADTTTVGDPQGDNVGGTLDLKSATAGHTSTGKLKHTVVQYNRLDQSNLPAVVMDAPKYGCQYGYEVWPAFNATKIYEPCTGNLVCCYTTSFPDAKTVVYKFPKSAIGSPGKYYWAIRIYGGGEANIDVIPNRGNPHAVCPGTVSAGVCNSGWEQWMVLHRL